ncbi:Sec-independent protein secretion pathway components [Microbacterium testaceum StLB037]|uniref:Sec-independent protein secretion pathway components n=1 Tax=Microbacterium testaceum (strain StLB037) TaxID=979556 RepID=E8N7E4_MICTS|nr:Sec-independent protein secretion pathway components [Microbacterium testaceum]BAJ72977.1 Sec-independent protein secretion pathway components [Microbacterium testaceum StLB037]
MFGLTFEKLLLVGFLAAVILGPHRLPTVVARVAALVRSLRRTVDAARLRAADELGVPADAAQWRALDPRQYDPRRIIAEALAAPSVSAPPSSAPHESAPPPSDVAPAGSTLLAPTIEGETSEVGEARHPVPPPPETTPAPRRVRVGTSAHPRWIVLAEEGEPESSGENADGGLSRTGPERPVLLY